MEVGRSELVILALIFAVGIVGVVVVNYVIFVEAAKSSTGQCASFLKNRSAQFCRNF